MSKIIGIDVGIASIGWGVIDIQQKEILGAGVRIFNKAETPKTGASLALPRRLARSSRRRLRRRQHRLHRIKNLFVEVGLITEINRDIVFSTTKNTLSPWLLRYDALFRRLTNDEWARALFHIAGRRGFKSNRKSEFDDKDMGKLLAGVAENTQLFEEKKYKTVGEMFYKDIKFSNKKRNHPTSYAHTISRDLLVQEIETLFERQRNLGNSDADVNFQAEFIKIFSSQRSYDDGAQINRMRGFCTFEPDQRRAPKLSYSAECFVSVSKCNNLTISEEGRGRFHLSAEQKQALMALGFKNLKVTYAQIRKKLDIADNVRFVGLDYYAAEKKGKDPEAQIFLEIKGFHRLRAAIEKNCGKTEWNNLTGNPELLDSIAEALTCWKTDNNRQRELEALGLSQNIIDALLPLDGFSQFINLSLTAVKKLLPLMLDGQRYDEACAAVFKDHRRPLDSNKQQLLPLIPLDDIRNPVVFRALTQARKVINAIIRKHGTPERVHIELARDVAKSSKERREIIKAQGDFRSQKEKAKQHFISLYKTAPNGHDLLKFRLYKSQNGRCPYSGTAIDSNRLIESGYVDIDHILPWSRTYDDSLNNKVLVLTAENRHKGDRTPFEYIAAEDANHRNWQRFKAEVAHYPYPKRWRLLKESLDDKDAQVFRERNCNDTSYIARYLKNFIEQNLELAGDDRQPVQTSNGILTSYLRVRWGLLKDRNESDLHHAVDALLVAGITRSMVKQLSDASRRQELWASDGADDEGEELVDAHTGEVASTPFQVNRRIQLPQPWDDFSRQVREYVENKVFVSRMPSRKIAGSAHEATIRSAKYLSEGYATVKTPLSDLTLANLENMHDKERNKSLYEALKSRLMEHDGKGKKAFEVPFFMPLGAKARARESIAPRVHSIKLSAAMNAGVSVSKGIAKQVEMIRTDVFEKDGKYYLVPIYVADRVNKGLPSHAIFQGRQEKDWPFMDESYSFCFSLFRNDLIEIKHKVKGKLLGYYAGCHRRTGTINVTLHDRSLPLNSNHWVKPDTLLKMRKKGEKTIQGIGIKTGLEYFHKYEVDVLGSIDRVKAGGARLGLA
ncbi:type II CRISPR RNA-guided endonuclease Cas9 [SAR92 clade bacterium H231]|nr:type II CRISPR RNA-guided endonuclease Cas9 [SAR92 clade bacterium H231]